MVFSSQLFLFWFLPAVLAAYYLTPRRGKHLTLTIFSYVFYGWVNPACIVLLLFSTLVDWVAGLVMAGTTPWSREPVQELAIGGERTLRQRMALVLSVGTNLAMLGFFKYFNFGIESWNRLVDTLGWSGGTLVPVVHVLLPVGLSFYTFHSISYAVDVYRGEARALRSFIDYSCFVSLFSQLVAGPIIRFSEIENQLRNRTHTLAKFARGVAFFSVGMAKKVLLANPCGRIADTVFDAGSPTVLQAWHGIVGYAFQIYFDFSGYSDMAIGLGLMLGFVFARNFDSPYQSQSITEFWRRWHISLSTWLRDYLYVPLGGNRKGARRTYINLGLTMLLGGLWHGASWNFVLWGAFHGVLLAVERAIGIERLYGWMPRALRVATTFTLVLVSWVFFRAADLPAALAYLGRMFGASDAAPAAALLSGVLLSPYLLLCFAIAALVVWGGEQSWTWTRELSPVKIVLALGLLVVAIAALSTQDYNPFIYYIF
ncbi:MAG: MBOAT family O-acyltransferase [Thermoanaerobaculia bacterium]